MKISIWARQEGRLKKMTKMVSVINFSEVPANDSSAKYSMPVLYSDMPCSNNSAQAFQEGHA